MLKLRATRPPAQRAVDEVPCPPGHDITDSFTTIAPASFKRLLSGIRYTHSGAVPALKIAVLQETVVRGDVPAEPTSEAVSRSVVPWLQKHPAELFERPVRFGSVPNHGGRDPVLRCIGPAPRNGHNVVDRRK